MRKRVDEGVQKYIKEDSIRPVRGIANGLLVVSVLWALIFAFIWYVISCGGGGDGSSLSSTTRVIETREMSQHERMWWQETITCLMERGKILGDETTLIVEPTIIIVEEDFFECGSHDTGACTQNFDIFISQRLIGVETNAFIFRHEFTHVLELAVKDRLSNNHSTDWWRNGRESICQADQDIATAQLAAEAEGGL